VSDAPEPAPSHDAATATEAQASRRPAWEHELGPERPPTPAADTVPASARELAPPRDRLDELLADPPPLPTVGALSGYRAGGRARRWLLVALVLGILGAIATARWYIQWLEEQQRHPPMPTYQLAAGAEAESRPDALVWTDGTARLGLSRQDPGVRAIVLPDRVLTLARGCDHAQVKVEVKDGRTVKLKVLVGEIEQTALRPDPAPPAP
jgi:hypothetical protein